MNFAQKMRLIWIDATLCRIGNLQRGDLIRAFGISVPQASKDIQAFIARWPDAIEYDSSARWYSRPDQASNAFPEHVHHWVRGAVHAVGCDSITTEPSDG